MFISCSNASGSKSLFPSITISYDQVLRDKKKEPAMF